MTQVTCNDSFIHYLLEYLFWYHTCKAYTCKVRNALFMLCLCIGKQLNNRYLQRSVSIMCKSYTEIFVTKKIVKQIKCNGLILGRRNIYYSKQVKGQ